MKKSTRSTVLVYACYISTCLGYGPAFAIPATDSAAPAELAEVVVTAQRVESDLQHTPVAVTALPQAVLEERNVTSLLDLSGIAPSLQIGSRSGGGTSLGAITIRGIGINASPPASPAVGLYIDEVYYPAAFGNLLGIFDVDSIQVLRGPQGTLFGRNTIGGALLYSSNKPAYGDVSGFAELNGGNQGRADAQAAVNLPLGNSAAVRLSGGMINEAGYVHDELNGIDRGSEHDRQGRLQLRANFTDKFSVDLKLEDLEQRSNGSASSVLGFNYRSLFGAPFAPNGLDRFISTGPYEVAGYDAPTFFKARFRLAQATAAYRLTDNVTFKSISAYSVSDSNLLLDQDYTPLPIIAVSRGSVRDSLVTQEFRLSGNSFDSRLHWGSGVYFFGEQNHNLGEKSLVFGRPSNPFGDYTTNTQSYAAYGQATFDLTSQLAVVAGMRYTDEEVKTSDSGSQPVLPPFTSRASFTNKSPLIGINYQAAKELLIYGKASQGFRAGGFSPTVSSGNPFNPETAKTFEVGMRWELFGRRLRVNPTVYHTLWDAIQFNEIGFCPCFAGPLPFIKNAGNARVNGAEIEVQAAVTEDLMMVASYAYLSSRYTSIGRGLALQPDTPLEHAPRNSFTVGPTYSLTLPHSGKLIGSLNYSWQSAQRSATTDIDNVDISSYGLLNGRITCQGNDNRWSLAIWGKNLTNKVYYVGGTNFGAGGAIPTVEADVGRPREYGATARYNF